MLSSAPRSLPIAVIVVTYNSAAVIGECLDRIGIARTGLDDVRIIVADNASTDSTCSIVEAHPASARLLRLATNGGYAAGINAGADAGDDADALLVMNADVLLAPGSVSALAEALRLPATGIVVPAVRAPDGTIAPDIKRDPTIMRALGEAVLGGSRAGRFEALGESVVGAGRYERPAVVDWAGGSVMLVSRQCHDALGGWDESFFHGSEEVDFCLRARDHGWLVRYEPAATAVHIGGGGEHSPLRPLMFANRVELFRRRHGALRAAAFRAALALGELLRCARSRHHRASFITLCTFRRPVPGGDVR